MRPLTYVTAFFLCAGLQAIADPGYPGDDSHNHDGTHPESEKNCGTNYMLPGENARLGSHSFMILGKNGPSHIYAEHRSGTPPHNYQFVFRVRLDAEEMKAYEELLLGAKTLPAFTTIWFDEQGQQLARTFWCLQDLERIFGKEKKAGDEFEKLFPIRASLQKNPDHEGSFEIEKSVVRGKFFTLARDDFELLFQRYIPAYLPQDTLRKAIREKGARVTRLFSHHPLYFNEPEATASTRRGYMSGNGLEGSGKALCKANYFLKNVPMAETIHAFVLLGEAGDNTVLVTHYYDQAPQNFQAVLRLRLHESHLKILREARKKSSGPLLFQTTMQKKPQAFCMDDLRQLVKQPGFVLTASFYSDVDLGSYRLGSPVATIMIQPPEIEVLVNRRLESLMNLNAVVKDVGTENAKTKSATQMKSQKDY